MKSEEAGIDDALRIAAAEVQRLLERVSPAEVPAKVFRRAVYDAGLAWVWHPRGLGGLGLPCGVQASVDNLLAAAGGPGRAAYGQIGYTMLAPTILRHASEQQARRFLPPAYTGEEIWCQLFSEPGSGSDLAGLACRARRVDGGWHVTGQKVWTTNGDKAHRGMLLARTDPALPKHQGIGFFLIDMNQAAVTVRPLRQMTGVNEFCEVFLDDAFVEADCLVGGPGEGWPIAMTTLAYERVGVGRGLIRAGADPVDSALRLWRQGSEADPLLESRVVSTWLTSRAIELARRRSDDGLIDSLVIKLAFSEHNKSAHELHFDLAGLTALRYSFDDADLTSPAYGYLRSRANSIEGGTSEIMRNIIAERILSLPSGPRSDKGIPWSDIRRN